MATVKFSELPAATTLDGAEQLALNAAGTSKRATAQQLKDFSISEVEAAILALQSAVAPTATGNQLVSGGGVAWDGGFDFVVSAATYLIQGDPFASAQDEVTLSAADPDDARIDVIAVDTAGAVIVLEGTAAAAPAKPDVDPLTQLELTFVYVPAAATEPAVTVTADLYHENTEWTTSRNGTTITLASTVAPHAGTVSLDGLAVATGHWVQFAAPAPIDLAASDSLIFWIASKGTWPATRSMSLQWRSGNNNPRGSVVTFKHGSFGFDSANISSYQQIVIPLSLFGAAGLSVDRLRGTCAGSGATIGFYADDFVLQGGLAGSDAVASDRMRWRGAWLASTAYALNDCVKHGRSVWIATAANTGATPALASALWQVVADFSDVPLTIQSNAYTGQQYSTAILLGLTLSGAVAIDATDGNVFEGTLTGNVSALSITGGAAGMTISARFTIGGAGDWTVAYASDIHFPAGEPEWPTDPGDVILLTGQYHASNSTWECAAVAPGGAAGGSSTLAGLSDVDLTGLADGDLLVWDAGAGEWVPAVPGAGAGDVVGPAASVASEVVLFDGTTGKLVKRATGSGYPKLTSGVQTVQTAAQLAADLGTNVKSTEHIAIACSDETTALTTGTAKVTFRMPYAFTLSAVRSSVTTAPTGSTFIIDINESGSTILSTKLSIDASEKTSTTAATPAVISDAALADDAEITIDFDQVGSTIAGAGAKVYLIGTRT